jgi:hypothetical protein
MSGVRDSDEEQENCKYLRADAIAQSNGKVHTVAPLVGRPLWMVKKYV